MFSQLRMREEQALLAQDYALEQAEEKGLERGLERGRAEGIEQGLERGLERGRAEGLEQGLERGKVEGSLSMLLNLVRQGILTSEVASQQLGMTVSEFEELLKDDHK
ncbi:adenylosuccinate lyase [Streptococcus pseudopneumoniae]|uniref:Adenylosuccinate lyase n=3 Tax=Streptococcus TaxID=1301 RepID=A0A0T8U9W0_9STRE|nr:adenylosuccinate lyase [Streptococcus pseudopneumoniae]